jgi:hypothetical protein
MFFGGKAHCSIGIIRISNWRLRLKEAARMAAALKYPALQQFCFAMAE